MTTEDFPGGSPPGMAHPAGVVPQPPSVPRDEIDQIRQPDFPIALRGYDREAVDAYVAHVTQVIADLQAGRSPQSAIKHALDQVSEETKGILERAHETADEITSRSQAQAAQRLERAEEEARGIVRAAETQVRELDRDADQIWAERARLVEDARRVADELAELAETAARRFPPEEPAETSELPEAGALPEAVELPEPGDPSEAAERPELPEAQSGPPPPPPPPEDE